LLDGKVRVRPLMIPDRFDEHSSQSDMYAAAGLDRAGIVATVLETLGLGAPRLVTGGDTLR
jgi:1-deoxy-D-xylulose-5-phosphate synthase